MHFPAHAALVTTFALVIASVPMSAQSLTGFAERPELTLVPKPFADRDVNTLLTTLDGLVATDATSPSAAASVKMHLWNFVRRLQDGRLSPAQEARVMRHLDGLAQARPDTAAAVDGAQRMLATLLPGKTAPDIVGRDLDGNPFKLSDYRGKVVVLRFSAEWCGICRTLNPYERLMQELYANWPFAILSVETGSSQQAMKKLKTDAGLTYRSWWDALPEGGGSGPIATAWNVGGYPSIYVLDGDGVIRFVDLRYEDLLKAVRQLVNEDIAATTVARK
jgi:thiol-disulfide isomerase/thioredoxin